LNYVFTRFSVKLIPDIESLQTAYGLVYPKAQVMPGRAYLGPWFTGGENVICALDDAGKLHGYAAIGNPYTNPDRPLTSWAVVRLDPGLVSPKELQDPLFDKIMNRFAEMSQAFPKGKRRVAFQYHVSERPSINYVLSKGGVYAESGFIMRRNLSREILVPRIPAGIEVRYSRMEDEAEQREYIEVRNHALVEGRRQVLTRSAVTLSDWQRTLKYTILPKGTVILAHDARQIIGSVTIFWNENENQSTGEKVGATEYIFVKDGWRKKGIGSYMICKGLEYLKENGLEFAQLEVNSSNSLALNLYERLGYVTTDESPMFLLALS
jgi:ribosomal protein S18 acetylase RimI-like enzyme